jgi:hypothetical protein
MERGERVADRVLAAATLDTLTTPAVGDQLPTVINQRENSAAPTR